MAAIDGKAPSTRFSLNLAPESAEALKRMAAVRHSTFTESLRRSVAVMAALDAELEEGNEIQVVTPDGTVKKLILL